MLAAENFRDWRVGIGIEADPTMFDDLDSREPLLVRPTRSGNKCARITVRPTLRTRLTSCGFAGAGSSSVGE